MMFKEDNMTPDDKTDMSEKSEEELMSVFEKALYVTKGLLESNTFRPFAFRLTYDDRFKTNTKVWDRNPKAEDMISDIMRDLDILRKDSKAAAIVTEANTDKGDKAFRVFLEHRDGKAREVMLPYTFRGLLKSRTYIDVDKVLMKDADPIIWKCKMSERAE